MPDGNTTKALPKEETCQGRLQCHKCHSTRHLLRDCSMRRRPVILHPRITMEPVVMLSLTSQLHWIRRSNVSNSTSSEQMQNINGLKDHCKWTL